MQMFPRQGLHPAKGLLTALTENSRAVFGLHKQGQQWAWSRGSFMNASVGKRARVEMAQLLQALHCQAVPGFHKPLQNSRKVVPPSLGGPLSKLFLWEQLKGKLMSLPGQSFAPLGHLSA